MKHERIQIFEGRDSISIPVPESFSDCVKLAQSDFYRYTGKDNASLMMMFYYSWINYNFAFCLWFRLSKVETILFPFFRWKLERTCRNHGLSFSRNVKCGYGLHIVHAIGIVVNATAILGNNVTLHQHVNIGSDKDHAAIVGDNVYIGPQVCLVEHVRIGTNAVIGAGSVVVKDMHGGVIVGDRKSVV